MILRKIFEEFSEKIDAPSPPTYEEELNRQCNLLIIPTYFFSIVLWIPYIVIDEKLFPGLPILVYFRIGLTLSGLTALILQFTSSLKNKGYLSFIIIGTYLSISTGIILGLVKANPIYMGGFALVILIYIIMPLQRVHAFLIIGLSLVSFTAVGLHKGLKFSRPDEIYGLLNLVVALTMTVIGIFTLDIIRHRSYEKSILIQATTDELNKAYAELFIVNRELNRANEIKDDLMRIAAHDLKDPLQIIILYVESLQESLEHDHKVLEKLEKINHSTEKMITLITQMLEIATVESGKLVLNKTRVDVGEIVKSAVNQLQLSAEKKDQTILCDTEEKCIAFIDQGLLQQVIKNLAGNAIKFSPFGKSVRVSVKRRDALIEIRVNDEGPGLTEEDKARLFGKFQKLSARPTGGEVSTGLGLAITKELVEIQGGTIRVESEAGKGSTFIVTFPHLFKKR